MNTVKTCVIAFAFFQPVLASAQVTGAAQLVEKTVISYNDTVRLQFLHDPALYSQGWDTLGQTVFWREVINMTGDTCIVNVPSCRKQLQKVCRNEWMDLTESEKKFIKDSLSCVNKLDSNSTLFVTAGKSE